ncbi:MAG: hypothetical protein E6Q97_26565 [Desulfurellales bacterium]|nr:MAG: hypothetical protein E6Q97_26565 [Desulfurellales bacterium]
MNLRSEVCPYCGINVFSVALHVFTCPKMLEAVVAAEAETNLKSTNGEMRVSFTLISSGSHAVDISCDGGVTWIPLGIVEGPGPVSLGPFPAPGESVVIAMRVTACHECEIAEAPQRVQ